MERWYWKDEWVPGTSQSGSWGVDLEVTVSVSRSQTVTWGVEFGTSQLPVNGSFSLGMSDTMGAAAGQVFTADAHKNERVQITVIKERRYLYKVREYYNNDVLVNVSNPIPVQAAFTGRYQHIVYHLERMFFDPDNTELSSLFPDLAPDEEPLNGGPDPVNWPVNRNSDGSPA